MSEPAKLKMRKHHLSEIINVLNDRFGTEFTEEDRLFFEQIKERAAKNEQIIKTARANPQFEKFSSGYSEAYRRNDDSADGRK